MLTSADRIDEKRKVKVLKNAIKFLLSKRNRNGSWDGEETGLTSLISFLALVKSGIRRSSLRRSKLFVKRWVMRELNEKHIDLAILELLKDAKVLEDDELAKIYQSAISHFEKALAEENVVKVSSVLGSLIESKVKTYDPLIKRAEDFLIRSRNNDGGWPSVPSGESVLHSTLIAMLALMKLWHTKEQTEAE